MSGRHRCAGCGSTGSSCSFLPIPAFARLLSASSSPAGCWPLPLPQERRLNSTRLQRRCWAARQCPGGVDAWGALIVRAFVIGILSDGLILMGVSSFWQTVIKGVVIIVAVTIDQAQSRLQARIALQQEQAAKKGHGAAQLPAIFRQPRRPGRRPLPLRRAPLRPIWPNRTRA